MKLLDKLISKILVALISILGFSACGNTADMYGMPSGDYEISGMVFGEDNEKLDGAMVTTSNRDTVYTTDGTFKFDSRWIPNKTMEVKAEAVGYESETKTLNLRYTGGDGDWYKGKAEAVVDFDLKKKSTEGE